MSDLHATPEFGLIDHIKALDVRVGRLEMLLAAKFPEAQGSGYTHGWDKGFAGSGDPYGIQAEYLPQSANPDAATGFLITEQPDGAFTLTKDGKFIGNFPNRENAEYAQKVAS